MELIKLMPAQILSVERLESATGRQLLNLPPGGGKTLTTLYYLTKHDVKKALIVCPASLLGTWSAEAKKWGLPEPIEFRGDKKQRDFIMGLFRNNFDAAWLVVGYEMFLREVKKLSAIKWDAMVCDESQKIKSPTAKVSKQVRKLSQTIPSCILLSGTPIVNGWQDIWSQVETVHVGSLYGSWWTFRQVHAVMPIPNIPMIKGWRDVDKIKEKIKPYVFTIPKEMVRKDLPPVSVVDVNVPLSAEESRAYKQIRDEFLLELDGQEVLTVANALVKVGRLRQTANGLFTFGKDESSKSDALGALLDTLGDEKVIIFSMYAQTIRYLQQKLRCKHVITGDSTDRDAILNDWRKNGTMLLGTAALGTGLNLQDAHYVIQFDLPFTAAEEEQRIARAWRTGQHNPVTVYNLMAEDTIDYGIRRLIEKKRLIMEELSRATAAMTDEERKKLIEKSKITLADIIELV